MLPYPKYVVYSKYDYGPYFWRNIHVLLCELGLSMKEEIIEGALIVFGLIAWFAWVFYIIGVSG